MNKVSYYANVIYSLALIVGGVVGFVKAQSQVSLTTGVVSGILVITCMRISSTNLKAGYLFTCAISLVLAAFFGKRFALTNDLMPGGLMLMLSAIAFCVNGLSFLQIAKSK